MLSFFGNLTLGRTGEPEAAQNHGLAVAALRDLGGTKVAVIQQRAMSKDYIDIAALLKAGVPLAEMLAAAGALYGEQFNPLISLKALNYFDDGDLPSLPEDTKSVLSTAAASVREIPKIPRLSDQISL